MKTQDDCGQAISRRHPVHLLTALQYSQSFSVKFTSMALMLCKQAICFQLMILTIKYTMVLNFLVYFFFLSLPLSYCLLPANVISIMQIAKSVDQLTVFMRLYNTQHNLILILIWDPYSEHPSL